MSYNASKFPNDVANLFKPGPPLKFLKQTDYPLHKRQTNPNISGITPLLKSYAVVSYMNDFPVGSENFYVKKLKEATTTKIKELNSLENKLNEWDPANDPSIKGSDPYKTIFVGRIPYDITETELQKHFIKFGQIEKIRIVRERSSKNKTIGKSKGYAFIVFVDPLSSKMACKEIGVHRGIEIKGRICIVDIERSRTVKYFVPRRLGGGLGGRGYSKRDKLARFVPSDSIETSSFGGAKRNDSMFVRTPQPFTRPSRFSGTSVQGPRNSTYPSATDVPGRYPGTSRAAAGYSKEALPNRYNTGTNYEESIEPETPTSSYKSRTARSQEPDAKRKREEPDY